MDSTRSQPAIGIHELRASGANISHLSRLARSDRQSLASELKRLGVLKCGHRLKVEGELLALAEVEAGIAVGSTAVEDSAAVPAVGGEAPPAATTASPRSGDKANSDSFWENIASESHRLANPMKEPVDEEQQRGGAAASDGGGTPKGAEEEVHRTRVPCTEPSETGKNWGNDLERSMRRGFILEAQQVPLSAALARPASAKRVTEGTRAAMAEKAKGLKFMSCDDAAQRTAASADTHASKEAVGDFARTTHSGATRVAGGAQSGVGLMPVALRVRQTRPQVAPSKPSHAGQAATARAASALALTLGSGLRPCESDAAELSRSAAAIVSPEPGPQDSAGTAEADVSAEARSTNAAQASGFPRGDETQPACGNAVDAAEAASVGAADAKSEPCHADGEVGGGAASAGESPQNVDTLRQAGAEAYRRGLFAEAESLWGAALALSPSDARLLCNRSAARLAMQRPHAALDDAAAAAKAAPAWAKAHRRHAAALEALGQLPEAMAALKASLALENDNGRAAADLQRLQQQLLTGSAKSDGAGGGARCGASMPSTAPSHTVALSGVDFAREALRLGRPAQAVRLLSDMIETRSTDADLYCERASAQAALRQFSLSRDDAHMAAYLTPEMPRAHLLKGEAQLQLCDFDGAMLTFQRGCKANPSDKELRERWFAAKEICRTFRRAGKMVLGGEVARVMAFEAAREPVLDQLKQLPEASDRAQALKALAQLHARWERHAEARVLLEAALAETPEDVHLRFARAEASLLLDEPQAALPDMTHVVAARPGWFEAMDLLAKVHARLGSWTSALELWDKCHAQQPMNPHIQSSMERARVEVQIADVAGAADGQQVVSDRSALDADPDEEDGAASATQSEGERKAVALKSLANEALREMRFSKAQMLLAEAIALAPTMPALWSNRAKLFLDLRRYGDALSDAREAIALAPEWPKGYLRAGRALLNLERFDEAKAALQLALELAPADKVIHDTLEQATWLTRAKQKESESLLRLLPNDDILGIRRAECRKKGCGCECYVQKQASNAVMLQGRYVRHDNNTVFLRCVRCGHDSYMHRDLRVARDPRPGPKGRRPQEAAAHASAEAERKKPVPHTSGGARGGLTSSYYQSAVPQSQRVVPVGEPQRIQESPQAASAATSSVNACGYYYAHSRPMDYKVPLVPKRIRPDGKLEAWDEGTPACLDAVVQASGEVEARNALAEAAAHGAEVAELRRLVQSGDREALTTKLHELGFQKLGQRKRIEQALQHDELMTEFASNVKHAQAAQSPSASMRIESEDLGPLG